MINFTAPIAGCYHISDKVFRSFPTGNKILVVNFNRKWWEFWEPKMIEVDEYKTVEEWSGSQIKYLNEGEVVTTTFAYKL